MRRAPIRLAASLAAALTLLAPHTAFAADKVEPGSCNITTGGIGSGGNTVTCNFGMPPEQLKAAIEAAVKGGLIDRIVDISKTLGVTEGAAKNLLKIIGEDPNIPEDKLAEALTRVAGDYKKLQGQIAALNPDNPAAKALVEQAKPEIDAGHFGRAHELLRQATRAQIAAAQEARNLREQAQAAEDAQMLGAASSAAVEGGVAMTEHRYTEAAELFGEAASYVPNGRPNDRDVYLSRQADAQKDAIAEVFRVKGTIDAEGLARMAKGLAALVQNASGETRARALLALGTVQRMSNDFQNAIATLQDAVQAAETVGLRDIALEAWIGLARAQLLGASDHGAAAVAFERATEVAGERPTPKQLGDLEDYRAELEIALGENEAGVVDALQAVHLESDPRDRFYAELDLADALYKLAAGCDYRPLIDAKSSEDAADIYGACRRAVTAAQSAYERAESIAAALGWWYLADQVRDLQDGLNIRRQLIDSRAALETPRLQAPFHPQSIRDVLVSRDFAAVGSNTTDTTALGNLAESVVAETKALAGRTDPSSAYILGKAKDIGHATPQAAAQFYSEAARLLASESGFFDLRRRGAVVENRAEIVREIALRLLALGREADTFAAFESVRGRGLDDLAGVFARPDVTADDRTWLAELLVLEAQASAIERRVVGEIIASGQLDARADRLQLLDDLRAERRAKLRANEAARLRFEAGAITPSASLDAVRAAAAKAGIPVLLYWTTPTNVIAWYVGPDGSDVCSVFLLTSVLEEKVRSVLASSGDSFGRTPFDETTARELFLYLLAPFAPHLNAASVRQILVVPQGSLVRLPFEALIDPASGESVIDRWAVSYAPNATMAVAALQRKAGAPLRTVVALVDPAIDIITGETQTIQASGVELKRLTRSELFEASWRADSLHILSHAEFDPDEGLLSVIAPTRRTDRPILAAELVALPLRGLRIAVISASRGALVSAENYGFSWALLAGGASAAVLSRWDLHDERWMGVFYREVAGGAPVALAAAAATREIRKSGLTHPYYWAVMQVSGR